MTPTYKPLSFVSHFEDNLKQGILITKSKTLRLLSTNWLNTFLEINPQKKKSDWPIHQGTSAGLRWLNTMHFFALTKGGWHSTHSHQ